MEKPHEKKPEKPHLKVICEKDETVCEQEAPALQTKIYFHVANSEVQFGEVVCVVGNHPAIGAWNPDRGVALTTNDDIFPCWISKDPIMVELHAQLEYKYVVVGEDGALRAWEEYTGNRTAAVSGSEMVVEDDEGLYRQFAVTPQDDDTNNKGEAVVVPMKTRTPMVHKMDKEEKLAFVRELEGNVVIGPNDTIFVVALQLPVHVTQQEDGSFTIEKGAPNDGRNFAMLPLLKELKAKKNYDIVCIGWPGVHVENSRQRSELERKLLEHRCIPVFPPAKEFDKFIKFCTTELWPVFHDVMLFFRTANPRPFNEQGWAAYQHINNIYANAVVPHTHESDLIWIHDYHLLMTPTFISRKLHKANIGLYLHTPFPSSDAFKSLPVREELLSGMLCADLLGFQFFAYARNFFVTCKRIYGLDPTFRAGGFIGVDYNGREIMTKVAHFCYPYDDGKQVVESSGVADKVAEVKRLFEGKRIFACMDRCDNLSGLMLKFRAFKRFLAQHPQYKGKAVLIQYCFAPSGGYDSARGLVEQLSELTDAFLQVNEEGQLHIVKKDSGANAEEDCEIYLRTDKVDRSSRFALFRAADVLLDTCVKAGLNLMPFEFITAHFDDSSQHAVPIVSEFSGCSRVLLGSIRINPWNHNEIVASCERALTMASAERKERSESNLTYVSEYSPVEWFVDFLTDLRRARKKEGTRIDCIGFGARIRPVVVGQDFGKLPVEAVMASYRNASNRVFFFDYEGTLAYDKRHLHREYGAPKGDVTGLKSRGTAPDEQVLQCLRTLCSDTRNTVVILSGRSKELLGEWFSSVPRIGLAAERGFYYKLPLATGDQWHCIQQNPEYTWKTYAFEIMKQFVKRTQGSIVENKGSALVWNYRDADQHFGSWQSKELFFTLKEMLFGFDVEVVEGKGYVEVKLQGINKGAAVAKVLSKVAQSLGEVDFVVAIGDDRSDEDMFQAVNKYIDPSEGNVDDASQMSTTDADSDSDQRPGELGARRASLGDCGLGGLAAASGGMGMKMKKGATLSSSIAGDLRSLCGGSLGTDDMGSHSRRRFFTCTVGRKPSAAKFYVDDVEEVTEFLTNLKSLTERKRSKDHSNSHTWSGGDLRGRSGQFGSMPALSSLAFSSPRMR